MGDVIELRPRAATTPATPGAKPSHRPTVSLKKRFKRLVQTILFQCFFNYRVATQMGIVRFKSVRMTPKNYMVNLLMLRSRFPGPYRRNVKRDKKDV